jgi:hypothetical protein
MVQKEISNQEQMSKIKSLLVDELRDAHEEFTDTLVEVDNLANNARNLSSALKTHITAGVFSNMCLFPLCIVMGIELYEYFGNGVFVVDLIYMLVLPSLGLFCSSGGSVTGLQNPLSNSWQRLLARLTRWESQLLQRDEENRRIKELGLFISVSNFF